MDPIFLHLFLSTSLKVSRRWASRKVEWEKRKEASATFHSKLQKVVCERVSRKKRGFFAGRVLCRPFHGFRLHLLWFFFSPLLTLPVLSCKWHGKYFFMSKGKKNQPTRLTSPFLFLSSLFMSRLTHISFLPFKFCFSFLTLFLTFSIFHGMNYVLPRTEQEWRRRRGDRNKDPRNQDEKCKTSEDYQKEKRHEKEEA